MKRFLLPVLALLLVCEIAISYTPVSAWVYWGARWDDSEALFRLSPVGFPAGSQWDIKMQDAMYKWNHVTGSSLYYYYNRNPEDCGDHNDNHNMVCWSNNLGGDALARTYRVVEWWNPDELYGVDIIFDNGSVHGFNWTPRLYRDEIEEDPYGNSGIYSFHAVALHELGHSLGLRHNEELSTMNTYYSHGQYNIWADDKAGSRWIYPAGGTEHNLSVSNWTYQGGDEDSSTPLTPVSNITPTSVSAGSSVTIEYTIENGGTVAEDDVRLGFYLSTNNYISLSDRLIGYEYWDFPYHSLGTMSREVTIPADVETGTYYVGFYLDDTQQVAESDESDNKLAHWTPIFVGGSLIEVPYDVSSLSAAISAAPPGGTILVYPGVYSINGYINKPVTIQSVSGPGSTIILADDIDRPFGLPDLPYPAFKFGSSANGAVLDGFTIQYSGTDYAIEILGSSPTIRNNNLSSSTECVYAGSGASPTITSNSFDQCDLAVEFNGAGTPTLTRNKIEPNGSGIKVVGSTTNATITNNLVLHPTDWGVYLGNSSSASVVNNSIAAVVGSGVVHNSSGALYLRNNIITDSTVYGLDVTGTGSLEHSYNNLYANTASNYHGASAGTGDISVDPQFSDSALHLDVFSECVDAGHPSDSYSNEPEPNGDRINLGAYGNTAEATTSIFNCHLSDLQIIPDCGDNGCSAGETIHMAAVLSGDSCAYIDNLVDHFQIDAFHPDCNIEYWGGDMSGVWAEGADLDVNPTSIFGSWTIPSVPATCKGRTVNATAGAIRIGGPPGSGTIVSDAPANGAIPFRSGGGSCFAAGTSISMADGTQKPIESVKVGDRVLGYDTEKSQQVDAAVSNLLRNRENGYFVLNGHIKVTGEHPFYVNGEWRKVDQLQVGDNLTSLTGESVSLESKQYIAEPLDVFNITVEGVHNYYAAGVLVHNKKYYTTVQDDLP